MNWIFEKQTNNRHVNARSLPSFFCYLVWWHLTLIFPFNDPSKYMHRYHHFLEEKKKKEKKRFIIERSERRKARGWQRVREKKLELDCKQERREREKESEREKKEEKIGTWKTKWINDSFYRSTLSTDPLYISMHMYIYFYIWHINVCVCVRCFSHVHILCLVTFVTFQQQPNNAFTHFANLYIYMHIFIYIFIMYTYI